MNIVTLDVIQKRFKQRIKTSFKNEINAYISEDVPQMYIKKALEYKLTKDDYSMLFKIGGFKSDMYPKLSWLCAIYIHPLTILSDITKKIHKQGVKVF
jgi:hypothetical protein